MILMTGNEIRKAFLKYFESQGHRVVTSSPLLPANDPTLLFTNAGMNQFKDVFLGREHRDYKRATSSQKCIRAGGKHNDLDEVGRTARHHTFFEMLGNFSFGDYFKKEAIEFAWDLLVNKLGLEPGRLWFSVFEGDSEVPPDEVAEQYWINAGAPRERVLRFGRKDNFWQMGEVGPCGPCSEIHYYLGENPGDPEFNSRDYVNGPGDTTVEIWNLVFMQFNRIGEGDPIATGERKGQFNSYRLEPLPAPSVDTGAGLERLTAVLQGVKTNYETDLIRPIIDFISKLSKKKYIYESSEGISMRVIADHARATAFSIADGIAPGNIGRNYVLRKIMRRAIYHGVKILGIESPFLHKVTEFVIDMMNDAFPELHHSRPAIEQTVIEEEKRFARILKVGEPRLEEIFKSLSPAIPPMAELARSYDTFGVPRDLIRVVLGRHGVDLEEEQFNEEFDSALRELQQQSAPSMANLAGARRAREIYSKTTDGKPATRFIGYTAHESRNSRVLAIIVEDEERQSISEGETGEILLDVSPFYAESGGQTGDTGVFEGEGVLASVEDTYPPVTGYSFHRTRVERGTLILGQEITAKVDANRRRRIRANHTGTHLLHASLREVLGTHVKQAGSLVAPDRLRFDFTHFSPLSGEEISEIEQLMNSEVLRNIEVTTEIKPIEEALKTGAMALFGEKYGSDVRVVSVPGFSTELCGGTHVRATGDIGPIKIISDSSIAAGVRRIEAVTADNAIERFQNDERVITTLSEKLKAQTDEIPAQVEKLQDQVRKYEREIKQLKLKLAQAGSGSGTSGSEESARLIAGISVLTRKVSDLDPGSMRELADNLSQKLKTGVVVLGQVSDTKTSLVVRVTDDLTGKLNAGLIVREISAVVGGKGGGRADMATGGGAHPEKLDDALNSSYATIEKMLATR